MGQIVLVKERTKIDPSRTVASPSEFGHGLDDFGWFVSVKQDFASLHSHKATVPRREGQPARNPVVGDLADGSRSGTFRWRVASNATIRCS